MHTSKDIAVSQQSISIPTTLIQFPLMHPHNPSWPQGPRLLLKPSTPTLRAQHLPPSPTLPVLPAFLPSHLSNKTYSEPAAFSSHICFLSSSSTLPNTASTKVSHLLSTSPSPRLPRTIHHLRPTESFILFTISSIKSVSSSHALQHLSSGSIISTSHLSFKSPISPFSYLKVSGTGFPLCTLSSL